MGKDGKIVLKNGNALKVSAENAVRGISPLLPGGEILDYPTDIPLNHPSRNPKISHNWTKLAGSRICLDCGLESTAGNSMSEPDLYWTWIDEQDSVDDPGCVPSLPGLARRLEEKLDG